MCEILVTRGGGCTFERSAYQGARDSNPDGAGYALFQKGVDGKWEVANIGTFEAKPYTYGTYGSYGDTPVYNHLKDEYSSYAEWAEEQEMLKASEQEEQGGWEEWDESPFRTAGYQKQNSLLLPKTTQTTKSKKHKKDRDTCVTDLWEMNEELKEDQILVAHFRMATSGGVVEHNTHPIVEGDYLVIHNGVFGYTELTVGKSDTRKFTELLKDEAKRCKIKTSKDEQKLIERLLKEAGGYYSIFIYSWRTSGLYYYKSAAASFYWNEDGSLGSTPGSSVPDYGGRSE